MQSISFAVHEKGPLAKTGDFFTATELANACRGVLGWPYSILARDTWFEIESDILIALLDDYDLAKISNISPALIKVAWARNWFEKWTGNPTFKDYDIYLSSSLEGKLHMESHSGRPCLFFPLATNPDRFKAGLYREKYSCDYCFTGSYWRSKRTLAGWLKPARLHYSFAVFGYGWNWPRSFWRWNRGFVPYDDLPDVYASTRLVIDDANETTAPWGSVNSRVFDALGTGKLVITNGEQGARDLFGDKLPVYRNAKELHDLVKYYLSHDLERESLAFELQQIVLAEHTYAHRAQTLKDIILNYLA